MPTFEPDNYIDHFVALVLSHVGREYPNKLDHVINDGTEVKGPRDLHPIFFGSFDWHSCVHGYWLLARALRRFPSLAQADDIRRLLNERLTRDNIAVEVAYLGQPLRQTFERTYGWAWLLKLAAELNLESPRVGEPAPLTERRAEFSRWSQTMAPLAGAFVERFLKYLPKATYPIRVGTHQNTAFGLALASDYARAVSDNALLDMLESKARSWYLKDASYPAWEPDGTDFLSPGLMEAECMRRLLPKDEFLPWLDRFFPAFKAGEREPATLFLPATISDRTDGQIVHLDGLNLSRAWCWRSIARAVPGTDPRRAMAEAAASEHLAAALPHVTGDYMGEHWLATFALLALTE